MSVVTTPIAESTQDVTESREEQRLLDRLQNAFGQAFAVVDPSVGVLERVSSDWPRVDVFRWLGLCEHVASRGRVEAIEDHAPLLLLAVPIPRQETRPARIAVAVLLTEPHPSREAVESAARVFGVDADRLADWVVGRRYWPPHAALELAQAICDAETAAATALSTKRQLSESSSQLLATFEELNLLHRLTEGLSLGRSAEELARMAVGWLSDVVPCESLVAMLPGDDGLTLLTAGGRSPLAETELDAFFQGLGPFAGRRSIVLNRDRTSSPTWGYPGVREVVSAPIIGHDGAVGWIAGLNHRASLGAVAGFGQVEASLLWSVATILGVHGGNRRLYDQRAELITGVVRALTSAIDAKDPYTCGHSDRVARISVRLAQQLAVDEDELNTIYLGGLLHDVGKIGVDDEVLRKPDKLTDEEFELIKLHPELGERILQDVPQLHHVLPIVRHHHEAWDGRGYPDGLAGANCPRLARIVAVADAIDAMGSDRPYRKGMPIERVEEILRDGAGRQWDNEVVSAYFAAAEDIQAISRIEREPLDLDVRRWQGGEGTPAPVNV